MSLEAEVRAQTRSIDALVTALTNRTPTGGGGGGGAAGQSTGILTSMNNALQNSTSSLIRLTTGTYGLNEALDDTKLVLGFFGPVGQAMADLTSKVGKGAIELNNSLKDVSKSGFTFDQDLGKFASAVANARMSVPQFQAIVAESGQIIAGLAGTASKGGLQFLALAEEMKTSIEGRQLQATGVALEELDKALITSASMRRGADMTQESVQKNVVASAISMSVEMDNVARLTGISRQEQQKAVDAQLRKNEVELAVLAMSEEEREIYLQNVAALRPFGQAVVDSYTAISTGGARTAEDTLKMAAIGPQMAGYVTELARTNKDASEAGVQRRAQLRDEADIALLKKFQDKELLKSQSTLATAGGEIGKLMAESTVSQKAYFAALANAQRDADKNNITLAEQQAKIRAEFAKQKDDALTGKGDPGALTAQIINRTEMLLKDVSAGVAGGFKDLNTEAGGLLKGLKDLNTVLKPYSTQDISEIARNITGRAQREDAEVPEEVRRQREARGQTPQPEPRALGGPVDFGNLYTVGEEGMEFFSPKQDGEIISNNTIKSMMNGLGDLQGDMRTALANIRSSMPTTGQFQEMFSSITLPSMPSIQSSSSQSTASMFSGESTSRSDANTELIRGIEGLNMRVERLITAVEDGANKNIRAVKSAGNLLA